jgi:NitT/TauT family transport system substrate-binding protein
VHLVEAPLGQLDQLYAAGEIDAAVTFEPMRSRLKAAGARVVFSSASLPNEILDVLVIRQEVRSMAVPTTSNA